MYGLTEKRKFRIFNFFFHLNSPKELASNLLRKFFRREGVLYENISNPEFTIFFFIRYHSKVPIIMNVFSKTK